MKACSHQNNTENSSDNNSSENMEKSECAKVSSANASESTETKIKYVEAPIPKVNPWKKNEILISDVEQTKDINTSLSDDCETNNSFMVDKPNDSSDLDKDTLKSLGTSKNIHTENSVIPPSSYKNLNPKNIEIKDSPKNTKTSLLLDNFASHQQKTATESSTIKIAGGNSVWKGTADTMSKVTPLKDDQVHFRFTRNIKY